MADNKKDSKEKAKVKRPTAQKRVLQSEKARLRNRTFKAQVKTAIRRLDEKLTAGPEGADEALNTVNSLMDKGVKKGVFKLNKASRTKSRLHARVAKQKK